MIPLLISGRLVKCPCARPGSLPPSARAGPSSSSHVPRSSCLRSIPPLWRLRCPPQPKDTTMIIAIPLLASSLITSIIACLVRSACALPRIVPSKETVTAVCALRTVRPAACLALLPDVLLLISPLNLFATLPQIRSCCRRHCIRLHRLLETSPACQAGPRRHPLERPRRRLRRHDHRAARQGHRQYAITHRRTDAQHPSVADLSVRRSFGLPLTSSRSNYASHRHSAHRSGCGQFRSPPYSAVPST